MHFSFSTLLILIHGIQRALKFCRFLLNQVKVNDGRLQRRVAKQLFDCEKICSLGKEMSRKTVPQDMKPIASF